ncbi:MAG: SPOR domain-containing protein, partial [Dongiaceae bacterium]
VELSGMQYAAASRPSAIPPAPAQLPVDESAGYVPPPNNGEMQIITVETKKLSSSTKTNGAAVARSVVTEDEWGDDWDEELVDASELAPTSPGAANPPAAQAPRIAATAPGAADDALPDAPRPAGSATTLAANDSSAQMIAPTETMSPASAPTGAGQPAVKASDQPATEANAPTSAQDVSTPARMISITPPPTTSTAIAELKSTPASAATTSQSSPTASPATAVALASSKPATTQPTESTAVVATTESGGAKMYTVQLAAYRSEAEASAGWMALTTDQGDLLNGLPHHVEKADLGADKGIFFRLKTGTFDDIAKAKALCTDLKTRSIDCMVVEATSTAAPASSTQSKQSAVTPSNPIVVGARY